LEVPVSVVDAVEQSGEQWRALRRNHFLRIARAGACADGNLQKRNPASAKRNLIRDPASIFCWEAKRAGGP
jgi:hypothetical protein